MFFFDKNPAFAQHLLCIEDHGPTITYQDWYNHAAALAAIMPQRSLTAIVCNNTCGSVLAYLCCLQNRSVPLLLDSQLDTELRDSLLAVYQPAYIFRPLSQTAAQPLYTLADYGLFTYAAVQTELFPQLALLLTTSGSTGSPKLVRQSYQNIEANAKAIAAYLALTTADRPVSSLPMHYTFGLSVINSHTAVGATTYLTSASIFEAAFWEFCQQHAITSLAGVPFTYECLQRLRFTNMDLPSLTLLLQAGGKLAPALQREYAEFAQANGKRFIVMYGQTEATARMSYLPAAYSLAKLGSIGIAIPGGTFHIMEDAATEAINPNVRGELCYEGPNVALGYASSAADLCRDDDWQGRLWTGDIAYRDADGFYYIAGRKKRFLKIMGKRINMDEIELLLKTNFSCHDFACIGTDDDLRIFTTAPEAMASECADFLQHKINLHPAAFNVYCLASIPKNSAGKTQYMALQTLAGLD